MNVLDERGRVARTTEVIAHLHDCVLADEAITSLVDEIVPDPSPWGKQGLHFTARARDGRPVLIKVNLLAEELHWTRLLLEHAPDLIPPTPAIGDRLPGAELSWVIQERMPSGLHPGFGGFEFQMILEAGVRFHKAARTIDAEVRALDESALLKDLENGLEQNAPGPAETVVLRMPDDWAWMRASCTIETCHGDLHMGNAVVRRPAPDVTPVYLIDFAPRRMPWLLDPAKPQILNSDPKRRGCYGLIPKMAALRLAHGLDVPRTDDLARLETIALAWHSIIWWGRADDSWRDKPVWRGECERYISAR